MRINLTCSHENQRWVIFFYRMVSNTERVCNSIGRYVTTRTKQFYRWARKGDVGFHNKKYLAAIRAASDSLLRSPPFSKRFSIIWDSQFNDANTSLSNFLKTISKNDQIAPTMLKQPLAWQRKSLPNFTKKVSLLTLTHSTTQRAESASSWKPAPFKEAHAGLERTPSGENYFRENEQRAWRGVRDQNHQGGFDDKEDESKYSKDRLKTPRLIEKHLSHLKPRCSSSLQKPRSPSKSLNPPRDAVWYCLTPHLTNHSIKATTVTIVSAANIESWHIKSQHFQVPIRSGNVRTFLNEFLWTPWCSVRKQITSYKLHFTKQYSGITVKIQSYCDTPTFEQFEKMSNTLCDGFNPAGTENNAVAVRHLLSCCSSSRSFKLTAISNSRYFWR